MGAYTCQFGVVHSVCRCMEKHTITCDVPEKHNKAESLYVNDFVDKIDPPYYKTAVEAIVITRELSYNLGNAVKYLWRLGKKNAVVEELKKARWYINDEINRLVLNPGIPLYATDKKDWAEKFHLHVMALGGNERLILWAICSAAMESDEEQLKRAVSMLDLMIAAEESKEL